MLFSLHHLESKPLRLILPAKTQMTSLPMLELMSASSLNATPLELFENGKRAYLAAVKDLCTKEIVGKSISKYMNLHLTNTALKRALNKLSKEKRNDLMIHSDQGYHFTHTSYQNNLKEKA
jgi:transposase InsO family protein